MPAASSHNTVDSFNVIVLAADEQCIVSGNWPNDRTGRVSFIVPLIVLGSLGVIVGSIIFTIPAADEEQ